MLGLLKLVAAEHYAEYAHLAAAPHRHGTVKELDPEINSDSTVLGSLTTVSASL